MPARIFYTPEEVDGNPVKRRKLRSSNQYALVAPIPEDGNDVVDKHFSDPYHIKSIYFDDEDEYVEIFDLNQDERFDKITEKLNDTQESMIINQNLEHKYDQYVTEYSILQICKYICYTLSNLSLE